MSGSKLLRLNLIRPWPAFVASPLPLTPPPNYLACDCSRCHYTSLIDTLGLSRTVRCFRGLWVPQNNFARFLLVIFHSEISRIGCYVVLHILALFPLLITIALVLFSDLKARTKVAAIGRELEGSPEVGHVFGLRDWILKLNRGWVEKTERNWVLIWKCKTLLRILKCITVG